MDFHSFADDHRVRALGWPDPVVEQFLFDHGAKHEFLDQYGHLELEDLTWTVEALPASVLVDATCAEDFKRWFDECTLHFRFRISTRPAPEQQRWAEQGSWMTPPLVMDRAWLGKESPGLHVVEGHTRIGILRGRIAANVAEPDQTHAVYVCRRN